MKTLDNIIGETVIENKILGACNLTVHAFLRFKEYSCKKNRKLHSKENDYFIKELKKVFCNAKVGQIKNYHNVIRLMNNNYESSHYLFNHYHNFRFVIVEKNKRIVTCEPIYICNYKK